MTELLSSGEIAGSAAPSQRCAYGWFSTLWPLAVIFHLAGNDFFLLTIGTSAGFGLVGLFQVPMLVAAVAMLLRPTPLSAVALSVSHMAVVAVKLPVVGNHEMLLLLIHVAVLLAVATKGNQWLPGVVAPLRWVLLIAYSAIAFSKLNSSFLDSSVSCAVIFGDEFAEWLHLSVSNSNVLSFLAIYGTVSIELAIPVLLLFSRTRHLGVKVGLVFHTVLALEPAGHVFDFTSVLFALFLLFVAPRQSHWISNAVDDAREKLGSKNMMYIVALIFVGNYAMSIVRNDPGWNWYFDYPVWLVFAGFVLRTTFQATSQRTTPIPKLSFAFGPVMTIVVALAALNAVSPYLEIRTSGAFNMYSNLSTLNGETNHLLLPATLPLGDEVVLYDFTSIPGSFNSLDFYSDSDPSLGIPEENLVNYVRKFPGEADSVVEITQGLGAGEQVTLGQLADGYRRTGDVLDRFFYIRAVNPDGPTGCRRYWGPAH